MRGRTPWMHPALSYGLTVLMMLLPPSSAGAEVIQAHGGEWFPYNIHWDAGEHAGLHALDILGHKPAGKYGRVIVRDGHFALEQSGRIRFWGTNITFMDCFPPKAQAPVIARRLAKLGVNLVRFHHIDFNEPGCGLGDLAYTGTGRLNPVLMDRLCFFLNELKKNGVYHYFTLLSLRQYQEIVSLPDHRWMTGRHAQKYLAMFSPEAIKVQRDFMRRFLRWKNPYSRFILAEDPALAIVELNNEDSLIRLLMKGVAVMPPYYVKQLDALWNAWLQRRYASMEQLRRSWPPECLHPREHWGSLRLPREASETGRPPYVAQRLRDSLRFLAETERRHYANGRKFLTEDLHCRALLCGVSHFYSHAASWASTHTADFLDMHGYFNAEIFADIHRPEDKASGIAYVWDANYFAHLTGELPGPARGAYAMKNQFFNFFRQFVDGVPGCINEWNHKAPTRRAFQMTLPVMAYGSFQDLDALSQYEYYGRTHYMETHWKNYRGYDITRDQLFGRQAAGAGFHPSHMVQSIPASIAYRRGDIQKAKRTILWDMSNDRWIQASLEDHYNPLVPLRFGLRKIFQGRGERLPDIKRTNRIESDTGEITWETNPAASQGRVLVNTPRTQAASGNLEMGCVQFDNMKLEVETPSAVWLISLDHRPIEQSGRILLVAIADAQNSDTEFRPIPHSGKKYEGGFYTHDVGHAPVLVQKIHGKAEIMHLKPYHRLTLYPLGRNLEKLQPVLADSGGGRPFVVDFAQHPYVQYILEIQR